jgi:hypothetical protein
MFFHLLAMKIQTWRDLIHSHLDYASKKGQFLGFGHLSYQLWTIQKEQGLWFRSSSGQRLLILRVPIGYWPKPDCIFRVYIYGGTCIYVIYLYCIYIYTHTCKYIYIWYTHMHITLME